jgi:hypothetical protein
MELNGKKAIRIWPRYVHTYICTYRVARLLLGTKKQQKNAQNIPNGHEIYPIFHPKALKYAIK